MTGDKKDGVIGILIQAAMKMNLKGSPKLPCMRGYIYEVVHPLGVRGSQNSGLDIVKNTPCENVFSPRVFLNVMNAFNAVLSL